MARVVNLLDMLPIPAPRHDLAGWRERLVLARRMPLTRVWRGEVHPPPADHAYRAEYPCLVWLAAGRKSFELAAAGRRRTIELRPGVALFLTPGAWFDVREEPPYRQFGVVLNEKYLRLYEKGGDGRGSAYLDSLHTSRPPGVALRRTAAALAELGASETAAAVPLVKALLELVAAQLAQEQPDQPPTRSLWLYRELVGYLEEHAAENVGRDEVARAFRLNPAYVSQLFAKHGEQGFQETLTELRLRQARRWLADPTLSVKEVARRCGFAQAGYFIKVFRRACGQSPGAWRCAPQVR